MGALIPASGEGGSDVQPRRQKLHRLACAQVKTPEKTGNTFVQAA
jgi:hypothetical protein